MLRILHITTILIFFEGPDPELGAKSYSKANVEEYAFRFLSHLRVF
jgi:hypothetical protein